MGQGEPKHKGVGLIPVVKGLKTNRRARGRVPQALAHYFDESVLVSGWYPERDYNALIALLAANIDETKVGGNVWSFFGRVAAQRDIAGDQAAVPQQSRVDSVGLYRNFRDVDAQDIAGLFLRATKMWGLYHDSGRASYARHPVRPDVVVVRVLDFLFPARGFAELQTAYFVEYARLSGIALEGTLARFSQDPLNGCEWHYRVASDAAKLRAIAALPLSE